MRYPVIYKMDLKSQKVVICMSFTTKTNLVHAVRSLKKRLKTLPKLLRNFTNSWERSLLNQKYGKDVKI